MKITKKETYGVAEHLEDRSIDYCPYCDRLEPRTHILQERSNYKERDKELWKECPNCKRVIPASSGKKYGQLTGVVDPIDSPFDRANITGLDNKRKRSKKEKYREELLKKANKETDSEIRKEILKGNQVDEGLKYD
jgi:hypothetical protein